MEHSFNDLFECFDGRAETETGLYKKDTEFQVEKNKKPKQGSLIWIMFTWHIVTTEGLMDALCAYIATKKNAWSCTLLVTNALQWGQETEDGAFYEGLKKVAVALGKLPALKSVKIDHVWECDDLDGLCELGFVRTPYQDDDNSEDETGEPVRNFRYDAIVLSHVCQITEYADGPSTDVLGSFEYAGYVDEFAEALQNCPLLDTVHLNEGFYDVEVERALLLLPSLTELNVSGDDCRLFKSVGEFVAKDSMRRLCLMGNFEITTKEWSELCSALGNKSTKLTLFHVSFDDWKLDDDFWPLLSSALSTNESLIGLSLRLDPHYDRDHSIPLPLPSADYGKAFAQALANHPRLSELHLLASWDNLPNVYHFWQEVFCNGVAQMTSLRQLKLRRFPVGNTLTQNAFRQITPRLFGVIIESIYYVKEWPIMAECMINSRRLRIFENDSKISEGGESEMMKGILAMNKAGRADVVDGIGNESKLLAVLGSVRDNLDCLYIHLRESPFFVTQCVTQRKPSCCRLKKRKFADATS